MENMLSDNIAVILGIAVFLLAWASPLFNPLFRWKGKKEEREKDANLPPVSIIIASHDDAVQLEKHLPAILLQDYPVQYEVIVVIEKGDHEVEDVLKRIQYSHAQQAGNARLYVTYIPETSRYMSRRKLAITLGVKAAKNEWLLLTDSDCEPASSRWLANMARNCEEGKSLVMGYASYEDDCSSFKRYDRFYNFCYLLRESCGQAYRTNCPNLMFRKSLFMEQDGYLGNLNLVRGEYDFLVNKYAKKGNAATETAPEAWVIQDAPTNRSWSNIRVYYMETRRALQRSRMHRLVFGVDQAVMRIFTLMVFVSLAYSLLMSNWLLSGIAVISMLVEFLARYSINRYAIKRFGENLSWAVMYDRLVMWSNLFFLCRHKCADHQDFTTHKQ
jgi:hypothetical protein